MCLQGRIKIISVLTGFFISFTITAQTCDRTFDVNENLISDSLVTMTFPDCTALVVISKKQCSNCSKNLPDVVETLKANSMDVVILRVLDQPLMDCKKEELFLKDLIEDLDFYYISYPEIEISCDIANEKFQIPSTPSIVLSLDGTVVYLPADKVVDKYGRPDLALVGEYACH